MKTEKHVNDKLTDLYREVKNMTSSGIKSRKLSNSMILANLYGQISMLEYTLSDD